MKMKNWIGYNIFLFLQDVEYFDFAIKINWVEPSFYYDHDLSNV